MSTFFTYTMTLELCLSLFPSHIEKNVYPSSRVHPHSPSFIMGRLLSWTILFLSHFSLLHIQCCFWLPCSPTLFLLFWSVSTYIFVLLCLSAPFGIRSIVRSHQGRTRKWRERWRKIKKHKKTRYTHISPSPQSR
ncbi:MAG: hypothetical protein JOS17DRAFT_738934 [Linnemannia elongata]|nr:MAG: hypothetical protein JOS17DRAFT_738934 [Linnemannia elongata]